MFISVFMQVFSRVKVIILDLKVSSGLSDVMLTEELGSVVMLTEQCSIGYPLGYSQEVTPCLEVYPYRCSLR